MGIVLKINGDAVESKEGSTILEAAGAADIYIPRLCYHPSLGSSHGQMPVEAVFREDGEFRDDGSGPEDGFSGCRLCLVEIQGREGLFTACDTPAEDGMVVDTETERVKAERMTNLAEILRDHPHACLRCAQQEGCSRTQCSTNVPEDERCCPLLGHCELQKVSQYVGVREDLTKYVFADLPRHDDEPLFTRDYNLCISCLRCVRACRDLRGVNALGFVFQDGKVIVGPTMDMSYAESDCRFCGACAEVCPTGTIMDKDLPKGERDDVLVPCVANCPAGVDIPRYLDLISKGEYSMANAVVAERIPFPGVLGRICFHPCEDVCRRGELDAPMGICGLKWFAADNSDSPAMNVKGPTGKRVAVVGSGPAGLSAAFYLAVSGHGVTVYESEEKIGGMLRYAIPDYRLPPEALDAELAVFDGLDVEFRTGTAVGRDVEIGDLQRDHDAVFIGTGACLSKRIPVEGAELDGVLWGLDFLKDVKTGAVTSLDGRVLVIGGGNVAIDVARSAVRLGASEVQLACLESRDEMPAHGWEIEEADEEGVVMHPSWGPKVILGDGKVTGIELIKCTSVFDGNGRFSPEFDDSVTQIIETDTVILAIGQTADLACVEGAGIGTEAGTIRADGCETDHPGVFAGGEASRGPSSVVEAVADGALAASAIDRYLGGDGDVYAPVNVPGKKDPHVGHVEGFASMERVDVPKRGVDERKACFDSVEIGYNEDLAVQEAGRCLRCDLRLLIEPVTLPPDMWLELNEENVAEVPAIEGVVQLLNEEKMIIVIAGTQDMHAELQAKLGSDTTARYFGIDADPMYSKRESELMQVFLQQFGKMPEGDGEGDDLDDLF